MNELKRRASEAPYPNVKLVLAVAAAGAGEDAAVPASDLVGVLMVDILLSARAGDMVDILLASTEAASGAVITLPSAPIPEVRPEVAAFEGRRAVKLILRLWLLATAMLVSGLIIELR